MKIGTWISFVKFVEIRLNSIHCSKGNIIDHKQRTANCFRVIKTVISYTDILNTPIKKHIIHSRQITFENIKFY